MKIAARLVVLLPALALIIAPNHSADAGAAHVDCVVSDWNPFSDCDEASMTQTRSRSVLEPSSGYGRACPVLSDAVPCRSVGCAVSAWGEFSVCDADGYKTRSRSIARPARYGGAECAPLVERVKCKPVDCLVSRWSEWTTAEGDGGEAARVSTRSVLVPPRDGGRECPELTQFA